MISSQPRSRTRAVFAATILALGLLAPAPAPAVRAADPRSAARDHLAGVLGGTPNDFSILDERPLQASQPGAPVWVAKLLDQRSGGVHLVYQAADGTVGGPELPGRAAEAAGAATTALERKADAPLRAAVAHAASARAEPLRVAVWLNADTDAAEAAVREAHPELTWLAGRPLVDSLEAGRAVRAELWEARRAVYARAAEEFRATVEAAGGSLAYASTSAPLVFLDLPASSAEAIAARAEVRSLGLEQAWEVSMNSAGPTVDANWTGDAGDQGNGVRVGVVEYHNVANAGDLGGKVVASYSTSGTTVVGNHPTWVAGAIASQNGSYPGIAPGAVIVSAGTGGYGGPNLAYDRAIIAAADWAVAPGGGDADILNASIGQDTAQGAEEARRYFDSIGWEDNRLVVASSGNFTTFGNWNVVSPGTGYNVLTVGGVNDRNTAGAGDDVVWYTPGVNGANYVDLGGTPWNPHGDYNKPNLSAPAVAVRTANGITGDGTSVASPIVAGIGAQILARAPTLALWPEGSRAVLMAGALRRTPMPGGGVDADHEGVGTASAAWSNRILTAGNGAWGGYRIGVAQRGQPVVQEVPVVAGQRVRVALAWSSHTSGTDLGKADVLTADLDLRVVSPNGTVIGSWSYDNPYEVVDLTAPSTGTMRIEIVQTRFDAAEEPFGLAWALTPPFSDIAESPFYDDIVWIAQRGVTIGCGGGKFCPLKVVTRDQMASFLVRARGLPPATTDYFDDDNGSGHEADINALAQAGITLGCGPRRYCPSAPTAREQMASFLVRAFSLPPTSTDYFSDDGASGHQADINALAAAGVTNGCGGGRYCPTGSVTREQMAAFLHRAMTR